MEVSVDSVYMQGFPKVWDSSRNFWTKSWRPTKFVDCINKISTNIFDQDKEPGFLEKPQIVGAPII